MSYVPLHHKYRPQTFAQLVGQEAIAKTLSSALNKAQIAPAYLFTGARGTGKTSSARIFAKSLNCVAGDRPTPDPCGECETCRSITKGNALDVIEIDAASNTGVDNIRELIDRAQFAPVQCRYKVYVIDECLTGDSLVLSQDGWQRIDDPAIKGKQVLSYNDNSSEWEWKQVKRWLVRGEKPTLIIKTDRREIRCTGNHLIRTAEGWTKAQDLQIGAPIVSPVNAAAVKAFSNMVPITASVGLSGVTSLKATNLAVKTMTWPQSWLRQNPYGQTVNAAAAKSWTFQNICSEKVRAWWASSPIGVSIPIDSIMASGRNAQITSLNNWDNSPTLSMGSSMALCWVTPQLSIPMPTVGFPDLAGPMASLRKNGWNTKLADLLRSSLNSIQQRIKATVNIPFAAAPPAILSWSMFSKWFGPSGRVSKSLLTGWQGSHRKDWLGGIWTMDQSVLGPQVQAPFNFIQKASPHQRINFWLSGLRILATPQNHSTIDRPAETKISSTLQWEPAAPKSGLPIYSNMRSQVWNTSLEVVQSIEPGIVEPVYDLEVEDNHNFVANGLLVHNCHMLTGAAFNALLKTLEEPPNRVVFVLATTDPQRVLPTIISRCQRFDFRRIPLDSMVGHLSMIAQQESINITQEAIQLVSQIAQGGLRDAESLLDQLGLMPEQVGSEQVWDLVGAVPERDLLSLVRSIAQDDAESAIDLTRRLMDRGREPLIVLQNLASFYRDLLIARTAPNRPDLVAITPSTWEQMCELVQSLPGKLLLSSQQHLRSAELQIKNTTQPRLWLEVTLLGLLPSAIATETTTTNVQTIAKPAAVISAPVQTPVVSPSIKTPVAAVVSAPVQAPVSAPAQTPVVEPVVVAASSAIAPPIETPEEPPAETPSNAFIADGAELQGIWQQILGEIDLASTRGIVSASCYLLELNGNALKIAVRTKGMLPTVKTKAQSLGKAATKALKQSVKISLVVVEGGEPTRLSSAVPPNPIQPKPLTDNAPKSSAPAAKKPLPKTTSPPKVETPVPPPAPAPPVFQPATPTAWTPDDPLNRAAKSLAEAFAGSIVDVDDSPPVTATITDTIEEVEEIEEPSEETPEDEKPNIRSVPF